MEPLEIAALMAVVLFAVLVGLAIPALLQARGALASARRFFDHAEREVDGALRDLRAASTQLRALASEAEPLVGRASSLLESAEKARKAVDSVSSALRTTSLVAPAVYAAVRTFMSSLTRKDPPAPSDETEASPAEAGGPAPRPVSAVNL